MSHEAKVALERIVTLCEGSENPSRRQVRIYDVALEGLGLLSGQRAAIIVPWHQKIIQARRDRQQAKYDAERAAARGLELVA